MKTRRSAVGTKKTKEPVFSYEFPEVLAKIVSKIIRLEYIDMAELLRDNMRQTSGPESRGRGQTTLHFCVERFQTC